MARDAAVPSGEQLAIAAADQQVTIVGVGGGIREYTHAGRPVLDGYPADRPATSARGQILVPWPNRIRDGRYTFDGHAYALPLSEPSAGNAIHGLVRRVAWTVAEHAADRVTMTHVLEPGPGYPFRLSLQVEYRLDAAGLHVTTRATNTGSSACPFGAGAHPWLAVGGPSVDPAILRVPARTGIWTDARGIPDRTAPVDGTELDFRDARPIGPVALDHACTDLERDVDGMARVELTGSDGHAVTLWLDQGYGYLMLCTGDLLPDVARRSIAVEPMTCPPNAFQSGEALIRLEPGQSFVGTWGISPH